MGKTGSILLPLRTLEIKHAAKHPDWACAYLNANVQISVPQQERKILDKS